MLEACPRRPPWPAWAVALVAAWLVLSAVAFYLAPGWGWSGTLCAFKNASGLPCVTCGSGRGIDAVLHGEWLAALQLNPLLFLLAAIGVVSLGLRLVCARRVRWGLRALPPVVVWGGAALVVAANWTYLIAQGR